MKSTSKTRKNTDKFSYHEDFTPAPPDTIFVFGSNLAGFHGAGAALAAYNWYGAKRGIGEGLMGQSYAIPTKDVEIQTRPMECIAESIKSFVEFTHLAPHLKFFVTRVGCGLAGLKDRDIAPLFAGALNCSFPDPWKEYLEER